MGNLFGKNKVLTAVFISGKGTNLKKLIVFMLMGINHYPLIGYKPKKGF